MRLCKCLVITVSEVGIIFFKGYAVNIFGFVAYMVSIATTRLCCSCVSVATDNM